MSDEWHQLLVHVGTFKTYEDGGAALPIKASGEEQIDALFEMSKSKGKNLVLVWKLAEEGG